MKEVPTAVTESELLPDIPFKFSAINKGSETYIMAVGSPDKVAETVRALGDHGIAAVRVVITKIK